MKEEEKKEQQKQQNKGTGNQDNTDNKDEKDNQNNQDESNADNNAQENNADNTQGLPKTQAELDNIIKSRLAREQKKQGSANATTGGNQATEQEQAGTDTEDTETVQQNNDVMKQLVKANAQIAAYKAGISPDLVEDAVALAIYEASEQGEATAENISAALDNVLKRHPEWKPAKDDKEKQKGFKVGAENNADSSNGESKKKTYPKGMTII